MKNSIKIISLLLILSTSVQSQDLLFTKSANVRFFSTTPVEDIEAVTNEGNSFLNKSNGEIVFSVLIKSFKFEKALMQEHFNENYMESDKYPKSDFKGKITNISGIDFNKDGEYKVTVTGDLTMHGVTKKEKAEGLITIKNGVPSAKSTFTILLSDYKINIPKVVADKISKSIEITIDASYVPYKK